MGASITKPKEMLSTIPRTGFLVGSLADDTCPVKTFCFLLPLLVQGWWETEPRILIASSNGQKAHARLLTFKNQALIFDLLSTATFTHLLQKSWALSSWSQTWSLSALEAQHENTASISSASVHVHKGDLRPGAASKVTKKPLCGPHANLRY